MGNAAREIRRYWPIVDRRDCGGVVTASLARLVEPTFFSHIRQLGLIAFPAFAGVRVMMMPFKFRDRASLPASLGGWVDVVMGLCSLVRSHEEGVAYITIDEAVVQAGETHRRPGLHVDGVGPDGSLGGWGGGGGYGKSGMLTASSVVGCRGWSKDFVGTPGLNGDCAHLADQCRDDEAIIFEPNGAYWCSPLAVHESIPMRESTRRQFARLSMPSDAPWYEGYTKNPIGVQPAGPIHPRRAEMDYRSQP